MVLMFFLFIFCYIRSFYLVSSGNKQMFTKSLIVLSGLSEAEGPTLGPEVWFYAFHVSLYTERVISVQLI